MNDIDLTVFFAQIINFSILFLIFKKFIADHLNDAIIERRKFLEKLEWADSYYKEKILEADNEKQDILKKAKDDARGIINQSENIATIKAEEIIQKANTRVLAIIDSGKREVEKERLTMLEKMKQNAVDLSIKLNQKLFDQSCSTNSFVEKQIEKIK